MGHTLLETEVLLSTLCIPEDSHSPLHNHPKTVSRGARGTVCAILTSVGSSQMGNRPPEQCSVNTRWIEWKKKTRQLSRLQ